MKSPDPSPRGASIQELNIDLEDIRPETTETALSMPDSSNSLDNPHADVYFFMKPMIRNSEYTASDSAQVFWSLTCLLSCV